MEGSYLNIIKSTYYTITNWKKTEGVSVKIRNKEGTSTLFIPIQYIALSYIESNKTQTANK